MAERTPGPWETVDDGHMGASVQAAGKQGEVDTRLIATVIYAWETDGWTPEDEANARLIAAAPELLKACEAVVFSRELIDAPGPSERIALLESVGDFESGWRNDPHNVLTEYANKAFGAIHAAIAKAKGDPNV